MFFQFSIQALIWLLGIIGLSSAESHINSYKEAKKDQSKPRQWRPSQKRARSGFTGPEVRGAPLQKGNLVGTASPLTQEWSMELYIQPLGLQKGIGNVFWATTGSKSLKQSLLILNARWNKAAATLQGV